MKTRPNPFLALALTLAATTPLHAATLTWDTTPGDSAVVGGAGEWNTTNTNWTADAGVNNIAWPSVSTVNDDADFSGTGGAVVIGAGGITANDISFSAAGYTVEGGTLTLNGATNVITATPNSNNVATISAALAGTAGFTKAGSGTLTVSGTNTGLSGTINVNNVTGTNNGGLILSGPDSTGTVTTFNVNGSAGPTTDGGWLGLANGATIGSTATVNLSGQGGNSAPPGTLRATAGVATVNAPVNILTNNVRISNSGGTSLTLNGAVTATPATSGISFRFAVNQGVILTNTSNSWGGTSIIGEGSLYCYPGALPSTTNLQIGGSGASDYGTNGTFSRALGNAAGQVQFGRANDGQRAMGFSARGGDLTVNLGGSAADFIFLNTYAKTGAISNGSASVTVTDATNLAVGMSVTGTGIPADTLVSAISGTTLTLNKNATATNATAALSFYAAADAARFNSSVMVLNGSNSDSALTLQNPVDLNGFTRFLQVSTNTATLTGGLKNSSATAASVRKTGTGTLIHDPGSAHTLTLAGLNTNAGTLELKSGAITVTGSVGTTAPDSTTGFVVARGGTFRLSGASVTCTGGSFVFPAGNTSGGNNNFILDSGTFDGGTREALNAYGATGTTTINGGLFICGDFRVGQSSTCGVNLNGGTLRVVRLKDATSTTATVNLNGGTLQAKSAQASFIDPGLDVVNVQAGGAVIDSNNVNITIPRALTEDAGSTGGGLTKKGGGILDLTVANTYSGTTNINGGVLRISDNAQLGAASAPVTVNGGQFGVSGTGITSISSLGRTFTYTTGGFHVADAAHTLDVDIALTGAAGLSKSGSGTIKLSGANNFTGNISGGSGDTGWIEVDSASDLGTGAKTADFSASASSGLGGIRLLGNITVSDVALNIAGRNVNAATQHVLLNVSGNNKWTGNINIVNSGGTYYLRSDSGRLELSGTLSNAQPANLTADTRAFNFEGPGDFLVSGTIATGANTNRFTALTIDSTGTTTLTGTNTYTGSTAVNAGKLLINGDNSAAIGSIAVNNTAILGGTGTLGGAVTLGATATLAPGASAGTLTTSANVSGAGKLAIELDGANADKLALTGTGVIDISALNLDVTTLAGGATQPVYVIVDSASAITGTAFASVTGVPSGYTLTYNYNDGVDTNNIALVSGSSDPFTTWATTTHGLSGGDAAATADPDHDGLNNLIEFILGGQPNPANPNASSSALAPTSVLDPANLVFTYRRTDLAMTQPGISAIVQYGSDLSGWTTATHGVNGVTITVTDDGFGAGVDKVDVSIPRSLAVGSKLFARLNAVIP